MEGMVFVGVNGNSEPFGDGCHFGFHFPSKRIGVPVEMEGSCLGFDQQLFNGTVGWALTDHEASASGAESGI
jgi:hypothetical protein